MMQNTSPIGNFYTIGHLVQFTSLTDRTIRTYIANGILEGEKINGVWHFTPEQVDAFIRHPAVRPSILAKKNSLVYDFLLDTNKATEQICMVLDLPGADQKKVAEFFCYQINQGDFSRIHFSFDALNGLPRVILTGCAGDVLALVNQYYRN